MSPRHIVTRPHPALVAAVYLLIAGLGWVSAARWCVGLAALTLVEYAVHRWIFHGAERLAPGWYNAIHGAHHRFPSGPGRRIVPLTHSLPVALAGWLALPAGVLSGVVTGYLAYEVVHALCHRSGPLPHALGRLRRHHALHHAGNNAYGVTSMIWDRLLGTMPVRRRG